MPKYIGIGISGAGVLVIIAVLTILWPPHSFPQSLGGEFEVIGAKHVPWNTYHDPKHGLTFQYPAALSKSVSTTGPTFIVSSLSTGDPYQVITVDIRAVTSDSLDGWLVHEEMSGGENGVTTPTTAEYALMQGAYSKYSLFDRLRRPSSE